MSRNFELLRTVGKGEDVFQTSVPVAANLAEATPVQPSQLTLAGSEHGEVLKLVQRTFLLPAAEAPHLVVYVGTEAGNGCSSICAQASEILASNVTGRVCLVASVWPSCAPTSTTFWLTPRR